MFLPPFHRTYFTVCLAHSLVWFHKALPQKNQERGSSCGKAMKSMGNRRREYVFAVLYYIDPSRVLLARYHVVDVLFLSEDKPVVNSS